MLNQCFGGINDYTELLLPDDILDEGGFIDMLNHTEFISDEDYRTTELLGWLYQFYISFMSNSTSSKKFNTMFITTRYSGFYIKSVNVKY